MPRPVRSVHAALCAACIALGASCATLPPPPPQIPEITWEEKLAWIMRLEDQRITRDPNAPPPVVLRPATERLPAIVGPLPPSDLVRLLGDSEARVRRRAALALGRVGLRAGVEPLTRLLGDEEVEVRQMAAFALGLIGEGDARTALLMALASSQPVVQGRAAEALGRIGNRDDAIEIAEMVAAHVGAGALNGVGPDELAFPLEAPAEAVRLGIYALARLGAFEPLAGAVLDSRGEPVSAWWPVAFALQRVGDPRAVPALLSLLDTPGRFTASFAARGLAQSRAAAAAGPLRRILTERTAHPAVLVQSVRALAAIGDAEAVALFTRLLSDPSVTGGLRLEVVEALTGMVDERGVELLVEFVADPDPGIRRAVLTALARVDPLTFLAAVAGLPPDPDWTVRAGLAAALGQLTPDQGAPRLTLMLADADTRVVPSVLGALADLKAPGFEQTLLDALRADDFMVRATSAGLLAEARIGAAVEPLVAAYQDTIGDSTYVTRAAILRALARLDPAAARPLLEGALGDRDWAVRVHALELLRAMAPADAPGDDAIRPAPPARPIEEEEWLALASPPFSPHAFIDIGDDTIEIELAIADAPLTVANFIALARRGFYDGVAVHRVVPDFVVQDGDPRGDGQGGPGYAIRDEVNQRPYLRGTMGMALDWADTGGSQFFITHSPQPHLDGTYTVFGHVVEGMAIVDRLQAGDVVRRVRIRDGVTPE